MTVLLSGLPMNGKAPGKRDFAGAWRTTIRGWSWWGNSYMAIRGEPFWPSLETEDLAERLSWPPYAPGSLKRFRKHIDSAVRAFNAGEMLPARLGEVATCHAPGETYPVRIMRSASNGQKLDGWGGHGPCIVNAGLAALVEKRLPGGRWYVRADDRAVFVYVIAGRVKALVMGIHTNGCRIEPAADPESTQDDRAERTD